MAVQRKGHEELKKQIKSPPSTSATWKSFIGRPAPMSALTEPVRTAIDAYDSATERDPMRCLELLGEIQSQAIGVVERAGKADRKYLEEALDVIRNEVELLGGQVDRDSRMPAEAAVPYKDMTDRGALWKDEASLYGTGRLGMEGASYVREMSEMNRADQRGEIGPSEAPWIQDVRTKLTSALQQSVVAHYTPLARSKGIEESADKSLKSKTKLDQGSIGDSHNTMNVDQFMLANDGFVFFYIEPAGMQGRKSRFGVGKEGEGPSSRIELGLEESGLLSQGWLMLSDFVQRDYPTMHTAPDKPDQLVSEASKGSPSEATRRFTRGELSEEEMQDSFAAFEHINNVEERQAHRLARQMAHMDRGNQMSYAGSKGKLVRPELLHNNILAGSDIIPGLVDRAVVEILRLDQVNPPMAQRLKGMSGAELLDFLLRDLLRPQAMIPNSVDVSKARFSTVDAS
ncbi:hypothetical protein ABT001_14500 [Streptomyces sp. NPDC002793]|uniref:hypothetical protein n=1 Tax=Streptomyces sp. NPDC002793 TaxID=3154432 RepID=UPI0033315A86